MKALLLTSWVAAVCFSSYPALAQMCENVLRYTGRSLTIEAQESTIAKYIYDRSCHGKAVRQDFKFDGAAELMIEGIPLKFKGAASNSTQKLANFCREFQDDFQQHEARYRSENLASPDAIAAWRDCVLWAEKGIAFQPQIAPSFVTLDVRKRTANPVEVKGIYSSSGLACEASSAEGQQGPVPVAGFSKKVLNTGEAWQVVCKRVAAVQTPNQIHFQQDLTVTTGEGSFVFVVPPEQDYGPTTSKQINDQIEQLKRASESDLKDVKSKLDSLIGWTGQTGNYGCIRMGIMQVCYGEVQTAFPSDIRPPNGAIRKAIATFAKPFKGQTIPVVVESVQPNDELPDASFLGPLSRKRLDSSGFEFHFHNRLNANYSPPVTFQYIAIGLPE